MSCTRPFIRFSDGEVTSLKKYIDYGKRRGMTFYMGDGPYLNETNEKNYSDNSKRRLYTLTMRTLCSM